MFLATALLLCTTAPRQIPLHWGTRTLWIKPSRSDSTAEAIQVLDASVPVWNFEGFDTLKGPFRLLRDSTRQWRIPTGTRLRKGDDHPARGSAWVVVGDSLRSDGPLRAKLGGAREALWDSVWMDNIGNVNSARLLSRAETRYQDLPAFEIRDPGHHLDSGWFHRPPDRIELRQEPGTTDPAGTVPDSLQFRWTDAAGIPLDRPLSLPLDSLPQRTFRARCGWLDGAFQLLRNRSSKVVWLVLRGSSDTLRTFKRDQASPEEVSDPRWILSASDRTFSDGWETDSSPSFRQAPGWIDRTPVYLPIRDSIAWRRDGVVWRARGSVAEGGMRWNRGEADRICQWSPPPTQGKNLVWTASPSPLGQTDTFSVAGTARAVWTGKFRWVGLDSAIARATIVAAPIPGFRPLSLPEIEIPIHVSTGERSRFQPTSSGSFRSLPENYEDFGPRGRVTRSGRGFVLEGDTSGMRLSPTPRGSTFAEWFRKDLPDASNGGGAILWTDGRNLLSVRTVTLLPRFELDLDTQDAPILSRQGGITFSVDDVVPDTTRLRHLDFQDWKNRMSLHAGRDGRWVAGNPGSDSLVEPLRNFLDLFVEAWNHHRPVRISPDAVWMQLLGSLTTRVVKNAETCRSDLVAHEGKQDIQVEVSPYFAHRLERDASWVTIADRLLDSLHPKVLQGRDSAFRPVFSTTTPARALANRLKILELYSPYFNFSGMVSCGIPWIHLQGTPKDWRDLRRRVRSLGLCGLEGWTQRMDTVLEQFVRAAEGHPQSGFWRSFVRYHLPTDPECGASPWLDGWITSFYPVDEEGQVVFGRSAMELGHQPATVGSFDFKLHWNGWFGGERIQRLKLVSGFAGVGQSSDGALFPELGWSAWEIPAPRESRP